MPCLKCVATPGYHSFTKFGKIGDANLFYTAPAKTLDFDEDGTKLANIKIHIKEDTEDAPWIWVVDCANMTASHYTEISFNLGLLGTLSADKNLKEIWIIRPNIWITATVAFLRPFSSSPVLHGIQYYDGNKIELYSSMKMKKMEGSYIQWLMHQ